MAKGFRFAGRGIRIIDRENLSEDVENYDSYLEKRGVKRMRHYLTPYNQLQRPNMQQMMNLNLVGHTWKVGDRYYKLADTYYDDPRYWWVIAWFNRAPTEGHLKLGDFIHIPLPLEEVLRYV